MKNYRSGILLGFTILSANLAVALAQEISGIEVHYMPGSYQPIPVSKTYFNYQPKAPIQSVKVVPSEPEIKPVNETPLAETKQENAETPILSPSGSLLFHFGANLPNVICAPLHVCEVSLQPGETIQQIDVGDTIRWQVKLARSVSDGVETSHLIIKPTEVGIVSNLEDVFTDKGVCG